MQGGQLKNRLCAREKTVGSWLSISNETTAEIMASAGFEWLVIDMEHAPIGISEAAQLIRIIDLAGVAAVCRLPSNDPVIAKNVLDAGASGIIIPSIETADEARKAVDSVYYPPKGKRGTGLGRAHAYGSKFQAYKDKTIDSLSVIVMIETGKGVGNSESIFNVHGIDAVLVGPYDLSASLGVSGQLEHPKVIASTERIIAVAKDRGISCGLHVVHPSRKTITDAFERGYTFLACGVDMILLASAAQEIVNLAR